MHFNIQPVGHLVILQSREEENKQTESGLQQAKKPPSIRAFLLSAASSSPGGTSNNPEPLSTFTEPRHGAGSSVLCRSLLGRGTALFAGPSPNARVAAPAANGRAQHWAPAAHSSSCLGRSCMKRTHKTHPPHAHQQQAAPVRAIGRRSRFLTRPRAVLKADSRASEISYLSSSQFFQRGKEDPRLRSLPSETSRLLLLWSQLHCSACSHITASPHPAARVGSRSTTLLTRACSRSRAALHTHRSSLHAGQDPAVLRSPILVVGKVKK